MPAPGQHNPVYADLYQPHPLASEDVPQEYDDFDKDYKMLMDGDEELLRDPEFQEEMRRVRASRKGRRNAQNLRYRQLLSTKSYHGVGQPAQSGKIPQPQRGQSQAIKQEIQQLLKQGLSFPQIQQRLTAKYGPGSWQADIHFAQKNGNALIYKNGNPVSYRSTASQKLSDYGPYHGLYDHGKNESRDAARKARHESRKSRNELSDIFRKIWRAINTGNFDDVAYFLYKLTKRDRIRTSRIKQRQLRKLERLNEKIRREEARLVREIPTQSGNDPEDIAKHAKEMEEYRLKQAGLRDQKEILKGLMNEFQEDFNQAQRKVDRALQLVSQMRQSKHRSIEKMIQSIA